MTHCSETSAKAQKVSGRFSACCMHVPVSFLLRKFLSAGPARKRSILALADQIVASGTNFLTGMIIARACTKEEFGVYILCFNVIMFIIDIQTALISSPYMVYSQRRKGEMRAVYTGSTIIQQLLFSLLVIVILGAVWTVFPENFSKMGLRSAFYVLIFVITFIMFREFLRRLSFATLRMESAIILDSAVAFLQLSGLMLLLACGFIRAHTAYLAIGASCATASMVWFVLNRHIYKLDLTGFRANLKKNWSLGSWMFGSTLLWAASMTIYPLLLTWFHGTAPMGIWGACWGVTALANPVMIGIQNFLGPEIVKNYTDDGIKGIKWHVKRKTLIYSALIMPMALCLICFGHLLVPLFYGNKYTDTGMIVPLLAVNLVVMAASYPVSRALIALEQTRIYFMANFVPLLITLSCGIFLVYQFGPLGVAWGLLLGTSATAVVLAYCFYRIATTA